MSGKNQRQHHLENISVTNPGTTYVSDDNVGQCLIIIRLTFFGLLENKRTICLGWDFFCLLEVKFSRLKCFHFYKKWAKYINTALHFYQMLNKYLLTSLGSCPIIFKREEARLPSSLLNIICRQLWYQSKSDYMDKASMLLKMGISNCWMHLRLRHLHIKVS